MAEQSDQIREKRAELILQQLDELPTLPEVALRVLEATNDEKSSADEVAKIIASDPSLTARVLQLVHRADAGIRGEVNTVERAVVLLGFEAVRGSALAIGVFQTFNKPSPGDGNFNRDEFWKHAIAVACCAELLASQQQVKGEKVDPSEAFVCGLLHDLGKVALDAILPKSFSRVVEAADLLRSNIADLERTIIGLDHHVVGKRLAEKWQFPSTIRDAIWLHGQAAAALPATVKNPRLVNLISLADHIVREQHIGYSGNYVFGPQADLEDAVGLTHDQVGKAIQKLVERIEPKAQALGLGESTSAELYQQALVQANRELGRVTNQLAAKNRRLTIRAKFFDTLSGFHADLRADAPPQIVLQAIGQTAVDILGASSAGVFSLPPNQGFAEVMLFNENGETFETSLVDCPNRPAKPAGDGPVLSTGEDLEWLLQAISPRLGQDKRYWICLEADGACIGGVIWGARAGEGQRLSPQVQELSAMAGGWSLALRTAQIREESRTLSEQLAQANRKLHEVQAEILRSRTLVSVGEMAAGAAHEMNNPLAVISGRSQLLATQLSDARHQMAARQITEQSHRISQIITDLMDFAKPIPPKLASADVAEIVERAMHDAKMHADQVDRTIEVTMGEVPRVQVDAEQVSAAIAEVIDNALQATEQNKGEISVHAAFDQYSSRVVVTVADTGPGMDETTAKRAFDPFFSAKQAGRRRGMGLAKALRWIEASGGSMRLESRQNQGTRMLVLLPAEKTAEQGQEAAAKNRKAAQ